MNKQTIDSNGNGVTNVIQCFLNSADLPGELIEIDLLEALNVVFTGDAVFSAISCQQLKTGYWEIFLQESEKGKIALSKSGSGLKTVICILGYLLLMPFIEKSKPSEYLYAFEEIENNIHPALLRRLANFIYDFALKNKCIIFLTTHSSALIDLFSRQQDAQIIHVTHKNAVSVCTTVQTYFENHGIIDDLDVRASDILQANGIIWVEGPSDRIYLNRWIEIWSEGKFKEGNHYQILFYGGRLLSHLSATNPEIIKDTISILQTNRNVMIVMDSDKKKKADILNDTKLRIIQEFKDLKAIYWVTEGREIENYISQEALSSFLKENITVPLGQFDSLFDFIDTIKSGEGSRYYRKKYLLAESIAAFLNLDNLRKSLDIDQQMKTVCSEILRWNN